jgi:CRP-like cAMP-binding protein
LIEAREYSSRPSRLRSAVRLQSSANGAADAALEASISVAALQSLKPFRGFSDEECAEILALVRPRSARKGEMLFTEGSPEDTCYVIVKGAMDVSFDGHSEKLLARLGPSSIFGQVALIAGGRSNGLCTVQEDTLLLEMKHEACYRLLARQSPLAYKFLAALTDGVIQALRDAERQLKRLNSRHRVGTHEKSKN